MISFVIPAFNEAKNLLTSIEEISQMVQEFRPELKYEIIIVDDHSSDGSYELINSKQLRNVRMVRLSRRSGSHTAIRAGLQFTRGEAAICLSADGQENITQCFLELVQKWRSGANVIWGIRKVREEKFISKILAEIFYKILKATSSQQESKIDLSKADFFLLDRKIIDAVNSIHEKHTSLFGLVVWLGFKQDEVKYDRRPRRSGESKWNFKSRVRLAIEWIIAFSGLPLRAIFYMGITFAFLGFTYALYILYYYLTYGTPIQGWTSLIIIVLIMGGVQLLMLGIVGEYLWKSIGEARKRPLYFIEKSDIQEEQP